VISHVSNHSSEPASAPRATRAVRQPLRVGYVPLLDSAPLIIAKTHGFFDAFGLDVDLVREIGWATVREKIRHGELDAAQAPASMVFEISCGLRTVPVPCITGMVTAHHGNAIVLSGELWELGVRDAYSLHRLIRTQQGKRRFIFAGVLVYSSQNYLMRKWLRSGGIDPDHDVEIAVVPPPQVHLCLQSGHIDGFCVAEPWGSVCIADGTSWSPALSEDIDPLHPEKVLLVRHDFHDTRRDEHLALLAALLLAARYCDQPENRAEVAAVLADPAFLNVPQPLLHASLSDQYPMGYDRLRTDASVIRFSGTHHNTPSVDRGRWVLDEIFSHGLSDGLAPLNETQIATYYREDIFREAVALADSARPETKTNTATAAI